MERHRQELIMGQQRFEAIMQDIKRTIESPANKKRKAETGEGIPAGGEARPEPPPSHCRGRQAPFPSSQ
eukprot:8459631-Pyramimonas_sp.AAC.1